MGVPINPAHYIGLSTLELGNVDHDECDMVMNSDKSKSISSSTVLAVILHPEYEYVDPELDALLLQRFSSLKVLALRITQRVIKRIVRQQTEDLERHKKKMTLNS